MPLLRNKEIKRFLLLYAAITVFASVIAACISIYAVVLVIVLCGVSAVCFLLLTRKRYHALSNLSSQIDSILHGDYNVNLVPDEEGELAVLSSELSKMTLRLREQAEHLERDKRFLSDSLADISHQLRTPLTSIRMLVPRLAQENQSPEQRQMNARKIEDLLERTQWLISTLLKIARLESGTVQFAQERVLAKSVICAAREPLEILMDIKNIQLDCAMEQDVSFIGDRLWTTEAIGNILKNCVEHCGDGGKLEIQFTENPVYTEIIIADNGSGFAPKDLPHLFDRFYRGSNAVTGSFGIGLNLSQMIIAKQNGSIKAENRPDGGAKFTIRFYKGTI